MLLSRKVLCFDCSLPIAISPRLNHARSRASLRCTFCTSMRERVKRTTTLNVLNLSFITCSIAHNRDSLSPIPSTTHRLFLIIISKSPSPGLIQSQRVIPRLLLPRNALRLALVAVLVVAAQKLAALVLLAHQRSQRRPCCAADGLAQWACETLLEGCADRAEGCAKDVA